MTTLRRITSHQIDVLIIGTKIGGPGRRAPGLAAARDYLSGKYRTVQQAADMHNTSRQGTARVVRQLQALADSDAERAGCSQVGVLIPTDAVPALAAWVDEHGGEVLP